MSEIEIIAKRVVAFDAKAKVGGGYKLKHEPCSYALIVKYLLDRKDMTYKHLGVRLGNITAQAVNHMLNRVPKSAYSENDLDKLCEIFKLEREFFDELDKRVEELLMEKR